MKFMKKALSLVLVLSMVASFFAMSGFEASSAYWGGTLKFGAKTSGKFRILVLSDIQDDESVDQRTMNLITKAIETQRPDVIVFNGDNTKNNCNDFGSGNDRVRESINTFLGPIRSAQIPFIVTFGNHDSEGTLDASRTELYGFFQDYGGGLMINQDNYMASTYGGVADIDGVGSGMVNVKNSAGTADAFRIYVMDSGDYDVDGYDACKTNQLQYYRAAQAANNLPHVWFQHIIVPDIYTTGLLTAGGERAGAVQGRGDYDGYWYSANPSKVIPNTAAYPDDDCELREQPCPAYNSTYTNGSHTYGGKTLYQNWQVYQSTFKGGFFGHDHKNSFYGIDNNGIAMGGTKAATYSSYNDGNAGCRVVEIDEATKNVNTWTVTVQSLAVEQGASSTEDDIVGCLNVPPTVYVGSINADLADASNSFRANQYQGNYIMGGVMNNATKNLVTTDLEIEFTDPAASGVTLTGATPGGNVSLSQTSSSGGVYKWKINTANNESRATYGNVITFTLRYTKNGQSCISYAYTFVDRISIAPGYYVFVRSYRNGSNNEWVANEYVVTLSGMRDNVNRVIGTSRGRLGVSDQSELVGTGAAGTFGVQYGFYDYNQEQNDGFINQSGYPEIYALNYFSPTRVSGSNAGVHFIRNSTAGQSPVAHIYMDESRERSVEDINLSLNYYSIGDQDGHMLYARPVGIKTGDANYSNWGTCANYAYDKNQLPTAADGGAVSVNGLTTTLNGATQATGNMCAQVGNAAGNHLEVPVKSSSMPSDGESYTIIPSCFAYHDEGVNGSNDWPAGVFSYAPIYMSFHVVDKGVLRSLVNQSRENDYFNTMAGHLNLNSYTIALKNAYLQLQKANASQAEIDTAATRLQDAIYSFAHSTDDISPAGEGDVPRTDAADADSALHQVPNVIYVAGEYNITTQTYGSNIVGTFPRFMGRSGYTIASTSHGSYSGIPANDITANRTFTFTAPSNVKAGTQIQLRVFCSTGNTSGLSLSSTSGTVSNGAGQCSVVISSASSSNRTITGTLGGTATATTALYFIFDYILDDGTTSGKGYFITDGVPVEPAPMPTGWYIFLRNNYGDAKSNKDKGASIKILSWVSSLGVPVAGAAFQAYTATGGGANNDHSVNSDCNGVNERYRTNFSATNQIYSTTRDDTNGHFWSEDPERGKVGDSGNRYVFCGSTGSANSEDEGARARMAIYVDPYYNNTVSNLDLYWNSVNLVDNDSPFGQDGNKALQVNKVYSGNPQSNWIFGSGLTSGTVTTAIGVTTKAYGDDFTHGEGSSDAFGIKYTGTAAITTSTYLHMAAFRTTSSGGGNTVEGAAGYLLNFTAVADRSELRNKVNELISLNRQVSDGYVNNNDYFVYLSAIAQAQARLKTVLYNQDSNSIQVIVEDLIAKEAALDYQQANYTALYDALDTVMYDGGGTNGKITRTGANEGKTLGTIFFKANASEGANYYKGNSAIPFEGSTSTNSAWRNPSNGAYKPEMFVTGANELLNAIQGRADACYVPGSSLTGNLTKYDVRYQSTINAYAQTIVSEWNSVKLAEADYAPIDEYTSKYIVGASYADETSQTRVTYRDSANNEITGDFPEGYFYQSAHTDCTGVTYYYNDWETSLSSVNMTYKKPHQEVINAKGTELETRYNDLRLRVAKEYYLNASYSNGTTNFPAYTNNLTTVLANSVSAYNGGSNASSVNAIDPSGAAAAKPVPLYTTGTWNAFILAYNAANSEKSLAQSSWKKMSEYTTVKELGDNLAAARTALAYGPADFTFLSNQITVKATYESKITAQKPGTYFYTTETWNAYQAAVTAATTANNATGDNRYKANNQATVNQLAANVYTTRAALVARKLTEYPGTWEGVTGYANIVPKANTYNSNINSVVNILAISGTRTLETITGYLYTDATRNGTSESNPGFNKYYNDFSTVIANAATKDLGAYDAQFEAALSGMSTKYAARAYNPGNYSALNTLGGSSWIPEYHIGGSAGKTRGGARYYSSATWNTYSAALSAGSTGTEGRAKNASQQSAINTLVQSLYDAYNALVPKKLNEYPDTWEGATGFDNIATKVTDYNTEMVRKIPVFTLNESNVLVTTTTDFLYNATIRSTSSGFGKAFSDYNNAAAHAQDDLGAYETAYESALTNLATKYGQRTSNYNAGYYTTLDTLVGSGWLPAYNIGDYAGKGARYYNNWAAYSTAYSNGSAASTSRDKNASQQGTINTLVQTLYNAYKALTAKKLNEYPDTWEGATGYTAINSKAQTYYNTMIGKIPVYTLNGTALVTTTTDYLYNQAVRTDYSDKMAAFISFYGTNGTKDLAPYDAAYIAHLAGLKSTYDSRSSNYSAGYYAALISLTTGTAWIPTYHTGGAAGKTQGGSYYYTEATWTPYSNALTAGANRSMNASAQGTINTLTKNVYDTYNALVLKPLDDYAEVFVGADGTSYNGYDAICDYVDGSANWALEKVSVTTSFNTSSPYAAVNANQNKYKQTVINQISAYQLAVQDYYYDEVSNRTDFSDIDGFVAALNSYKAYITSNKNQTTAYNVVYQTGWNWIFTQLNTRRNTAVFSAALTEANLATYYGRFLSNNLGTARVSGAEAISDIISDKVNFIGDGATTADQAAMNAYMKSLYDELRQTPAVSKQLTLAINQANTKKDTEVQVYDPMQLNGRAKVTNYSYYTAASRTALAAVISAIPSYTLFNATSAALGFYDATNPNLAIIEGTESAKVFKAAGLTPNLYGASQYAENTSTNPDYKLVINAPFLSGINDAITYAKSIIYNDGTGANSTLKQTAAVNPAGGALSYATYTAASTDGVLTMLNAAADLSAYTVADQAALAIMTKNIIDEVDDTTQIYNATGGLTGTLNNAGSGANIASASNGLVLADAYYGFLNTQKVTAYDAKGLVWNTNGTLKTDANDTYLGQYYFQGTSDPATGWYAYLAALDSATAGTGKKSNQQAAVDALAAGVYNTRTALRYKVLGQSTYFASAETAANAAAAMIAQTVGYKRYDVTGATSPTVTNNTIVPYTQAYIDLVNNKVNTFTAAYLAYKTTYSDTMNISYEADLQAATQTFQSDIATKQYLALNSSSVFYDAFDDLRNKFVAGTYNTTTGAFTSTVLGATTKAAVEAELDSINAMFTAGKTVNDIYSGTTTYLSKAVDLMDELYNYTTTTRATDAVFAETLRTNLTNFLELTVPVKVYNSNLGTSGVVIYDGTQQIFTTNFINTTKAALNTYFASSANWPFIYQVDDNLFSATEGATNGATYSGTAYTHPVSTIAGIYNKVGTKAAYYKTALTTNVSVRFENHMTEIYSGTNRTNSLYFLDASGNAYVLAAIGSGPANTSQTGTPFKTTGMPWVNPTYYTTGSGYKFTNVNCSVLVKASDAPTTNKSNIYYPLSTSTQNPIPWFTEGTATAQRTVAFVNNLLFNDDNSVNYGAYSKNSKLNASATAQTAANNIINNGWSAAYQTALVTQFTAVQKDLDTRVGKLYYNIFNLTERNAIEAYQEVTDAYLAAIGRSTSFTNAAATNNFNNFGAITTAQKSYAQTTALGGRIYNPAYLDQSTYGMSYSESPAGSGIYYSTELPGAYVSTASLDTLNNTIFNSKLKMDQADDVNGSNPGSYLSQMEAAIRALQIKAADYSEIYDLITQFKNDNLAGNETFGSFTSSTPVVTVHGLGQTVGSNAYNYKTVEGAPAGYANNNGFYEKQYYTDASWAAVNNYLTSNLLVTDAVNYNAGLNLTGKYATATNTAQVANYLSGLKSVIDQLELKPATVTTLTTNIISGSQAVIDSDYYDVEDPTWATFLEKLNIAQSLSDGVSVIRQAAVDAAAAELYTAFQALKAIVETVKPVMNVLDSVASVKSLVTGDAGLGISANQVVSGTFTYPNLGNYSMVIYTNEINPMIALNVKDTETAIGSTGTTRASKPERMTVTRTDGTAAALAKVITTKDQVVDLPTGVAALHEKWVATVTGSTPFAIKTAPANGSYESTNGVTAILQPQFDPTQGSQFVVYTINATDSAQNIKTHTTAYNYAKQLVFDSVGDAAYVDSTVTTDANQLITICVKYNNTMPLEKDGDTPVVDSTTGRTSITSDEGYVNGERTGGPVVWSNVEKNNVQGVYQQIYKLYRDAYNVAGTWEFVSPIDTSAYTAGGSNIPIPNDPTLGQANLGSFWYVLKSGASDFDDAVITAYYTDQGVLTKAERATVAKERASELLTNSSYLNEFKASCMSTARFGKYGAYDNWSQQPKTIGEGNTVRSVTNGDLVYIHTIDRWGNAVNRVVEVEKVDLLTPVVTSTTNGAVNVVEDGGSGIAKVDLFNYTMGTQGAPLYKDFCYSTKHLKGTSNVSVDGSVWSYANNQFEISNLAANTKYTLAVTDYSGRVGSNDVRSDEDGTIVITVNNAYTGPIINSDLQLEFTDAEQGALGSENVITLNGETTIILNSDASSAIAQAGPTGSVFADTATPLRFTTSADVTEIKVSNLTDNTEETILKADATVTTLDNGDCVWEVSRTFAEGTTEFSALAKIGDTWDTFSKDFTVTGTNKSVRLSIQATGLGSVGYSINGKYIGKASLTILTVPYGAEITFSGNPTSTTLIQGSEFIYWLNNVSNRVIGYDRVRVFTAVNDLDYTAIFTINSSLREGKHLVTYVNGAGNIVETFEVKAGDDYTVPAGPALTDYSFVEWSMDKAEAINGTANVVIEPIYTIVTTNTVTLTTGNYTVTGAGSYQSTGNTRPSTTISTSAINGSGDSFLYWFDEDTNEIASYNRVYTFFVLKDTTLTPVYGNEESITAKPVNRITLTKFDADTHKLNIYSERSVPTGYQLIESGIVVTKSASVAADTENFIIGAPSVGRGVSSSTAANGYYSVAVSDMTETTPCYARAYISYQDAQGNIFTDYSAVTAYPAG